MSNSYFHPVTFAVIFQTCPFGCCLSTDFVVVFLLNCLFLQILLPVVEVIPYYYSIRLAAVASRKDILDLEKWLSNNLTTYKDAFFEVILLPCYCDF